MASIAALPGGGEGGGGGGGGGGVEKNGGYRWCLQQQNQQHQQQQQHSQGARVREKITPIMRERLEGRARQTERKSYHHVGQGMLVMLPLLRRLLLLLLHANATAGVGGEDLPLMLQWLMSGYLAHTLLKQKCSFIFL